VPPRRRKAQQRSHAKKPARGATSPKHIARGNFSYAAIAQDTKTEVTVTNETTGGVRAPLEFRVTVFGASLGLKANLINGVGSLENKVTKAGEHYVTGTDMFPVEEVSTTEGAGCKPFANGNGGTGGSGVGAEGTVILNVLKATSEGQGDAIKLSPAGEGGLATFTLQNCTGGLNGTYTVTGSVRCIPDGATCKFSHAETTAANTLKMGGAKVGLSGSLTFSGRANSKEPYTPIGTTTVETS
jgi:hypothetical protein